MRFAIPVKEGVGLDAAIDTSLSECHRLLVVDTDGPYLQAMKVVLNESPGDWGSMVSRMADEHVNAAVFSEITEDRVEALSMMDIVPYVGAHGTACDALRCACDGDLQDARGGAACSRTAARTPRGRRSLVGTVAEPKDGLSIGDRAPDVAFYGPDGAALMLSEVRGDVSVLAILSSQEHRACSIATNVLELADRHSAEGTSVKYVCISEAASGFCDPTANVIQTCGLRSPRVVGLCDPSSVVRKLFRTGDALVYFVIGHDAKIVGRGSLNDLSSMEKAVRKAVAQHRASLANDRHAA